jgi:MYXO-CTERM domain-containing protein
MATRIQIFSAAASLAVTLHVAAPARAQTAQSVEGEPGFRYLLYLPHEHDALKRWPVIVFLHGGGENGTEITELLGHSLPALVEQESWDWPFIVVSPQLEGGQWKEHVEDLTAVLDRIETEFGGDPNRAYVTGLSWGGMGSWDFGVLLPDRFAALLPLAANAAQEPPWDERANVLTKPVFIAHGTMDTVVDDQGDVDRVADLESDGATFYEFDYALADQGNDAIPLEVMNHEQVFGHFVDYDHNVWDAVYGTVGGTPKTVPYEWLLQHSLDGSAFVDPRDAPLGGSGGTAGVGGGGLGGAGSGGNGGTAGASGSGGAAGGGMSGSGGLAAGAGTGGSAPSAPVTAPEPEVAACACRSRGTSSPASAAAFAWLALVLGWRRRNVSR